MQNLSLFVIMGQEAMSDVSINTEYNLDVRGE